MRKKIIDEFATKAKRREIKKRPRMKMHGTSLRRPQSHGGKKLVQR